MQQIAAHRQCSAARGCTRKHRPEAGPRTVGYEAYGERAVCDRRRAAPLPVAVAQRDRKVIVEIDRHAAATDAIELTAEDARKCFTAAGHIT